jgi:hypothetical protein
METFSMDIYLRELMFFMFNDLYYKDKVFIDVKSYFFSSCDEPNSFHHCFIDRSEREKLDFVKIMDTTTQSINISKGETDKKNSYNIDRYIGSFISLTNNNIYTQMNIFDHTTLYRISENDKIDNHHRNNVKSIFLKPFTKIALK